MTNDTFFRPFIHSNDFHHSVRDADLPKLKMFALLELDKHKGKQRDVVSIRPIEIFNSFVFYPKLVVIFCAFSLSFDHRRCAKSKVFLWRL